MPTSALRVPLLAVLLFVSPLAVGNGRGGAAPELIAVVTRIDGGVTVAGTADRRKPRPARLFQAVRRGETADVPPAGRAGLVCSTDHWIELVGPAHWTLTEAACRAGRPLPAGTFRSVALQGGRLLALRGAFVFERRTRGGEEDGEIPLVLSPRRTAVLEPRPGIVWTRVPGAVNYAVELVGPEPWMVLLEADRISCGPGSGEWPGLDVCTLPYPSDQPALPPGSEVFVSVAVRQGGAAPWRKSQEPNPVRLLEGARAEEVSRRLAALASTVGDAPTRRLLAAGVLAESGLYGAAAAAYREALAVRPAAEVQVALGDVYRASGLFRLGRSAYQAALDAKPDRAVAAAAELGLGAIERARGYPDEARVHLRRARKLYGQLGLKEERAAVERMLKEMASPAHPL